LLQRHTPLDVLTAFGGRPDPPRRGYWDAVCGFKDSEEGVQVRSAESSAAFAGLPHRVSSLPLLEGQYVDVRSEEDTEALSDAVASWAGSNPGGLVALPAGAGRSPTWLGRLRQSERIAQHKEHLFVRDAALAALDERWTPVLYEELPYLLGGTADRAVDRVARRLGRRATLVELPVDRDEKATRVAVYASQVPLISPPQMRLDDPSALPPIERFWLLER
jgi:hypothetical protein